MITTKIETTPKPFLKWAGGKGQLLSQLDELLPDNLNGKEFTYIELFCPMALRTAECMMA